MAPARDTESKARESVASRAFPFVPVRRPAGAHAETQPGPFPPEAPPAPGGRAQGQEQAIQPAAPPGKKKPENKENLRAMW